MDRVPSRSGTNTHTHTSHMTHGTDSEKLEMCCIIMHFTLHHLSTLHPHLTSQLSDRDTHRRKTCCFCCGFLCL
jgi:hypothetical protein